MTRLVSFGPEVHFLYISFMFKLTILYYLDLIEVLIGRDGLRWATVTKMGPNDACRVVWAISTFSFISFIFKLTFLYYLDLVVIG